MGDSNVTEVEEEHPLLVTLLSTIILWSWSFLLL